MSDLSERWASYARLQACLAQRLDLDSVAWGLEAALDHLLQPDAVSDIDRSARSGARKERHRARLRRIYLAPAVTSGSEVSDHIEALDLLRRLQNQVKPSDWSLLEAVADGHSYSTLAEVRRIEPGAIRTRVCRLRQILKRAAA